MQQLSTVGGWESIKSTARMSQCDALGSREWMSVTETSKGTERICITLSLGIEATRQKTGEMEGKESYFPFVSGGSRDQLGTV